MLPDDYKDIDNLNTFKNNVKKWKPENSPWRPCEIYISDIRFFLERKISLEYSNIFGIEAVACQYRFANNKYMLPFLRF